MLEAWETLLEQAENGDYDEQQDALFQIGLILERHNPAIEGEPDMYEEALSRELLRLTLAPSRQADAINDLLKWAIQDAAAADACLYAVSRAEVGLVIEPLLQFIQRQGPKMNDEVAYQTVVALDTCLRQGLDAVKQALAKYDPTAQLDEWQDADDDLLADKALFALRRVNHLLGQA